MNFALEQALAPFTAPHSATSPISAALKDQCIVPKLLASINDLLKMLDISRTTLHDLRLKGDFPTPIKIGNSSRNLRWHIPAIIAWIEQQQQREADEDASGITDPY